ncbi:Carboxypeptidase regulatory-like domain-containing protein [Sporobacter termitidis DSM 10068]|uniref:Carboxypeptidase regulatory-like domain-containing protein n=1 Tax=Sporobacter termitidis DSM 10068 TaxID=1123282 RepID=A0A1M5Y5Z8_9FIRM|nr:carboxypeptidase-like regulatory domain-containing protein [Sporobacter termitidis]SHI06913.1 Carboxypeptidase regulatory-like domain-containing protein [Sporobacter termitidis DSM 10068]
MSQTEKSRNRRRNAFLWLLVTVLVLQAAAPVYGVVRDAGLGETIFTLDSSLSVVRRTNDTPGLLERIHDFLFQRKSATAVSYTIDLAGQVIYANGAPFAEGAIMLESTPRYATTDQSGYFAFTDVAEGRHTLSVLDGNGGVLAQAAFTIDYADNIKNVTRVRLSDGTLVFHVSVDIAVLELTVILSQGEDGAVRGIEDIVLGPSPEADASSGTTASPEPSGPSTAPSPSPAAPPPPSSGGGGGDTPPALDVYDAKTAFSAGAAAKIDIFGARKRLAPGMKGSYRFTVDNAANAFPVRCLVDFIADDTLPEGHKLPLRFRLRANGKYVAGGDNTWLSPGALGRVETLRGGSAVTYTLEWYWPESSGDNALAAYGGIPGYSYTLTIRVSAEKQ